MKIKCWLGLHDWQEHETVLFTFKVCRHCGKVYHLMKDRSEKW